MEEKKRFATSLEAESQAEPPMVVLVKDLGEWALNDIIARLELDKKNPKVDHYHKKYWEIAVACLGEQEVKKRLKTTWKKGGFV